MRAATFFFLFVAGVTALKSATNALFLVRNDPRHLPYLYLATALAISLVTSDVGKRLGRFGAKPVLRNALVIAGSVLAVLGICAVLDFRPALGVLYVAGEVYATAISVLFWARLGEVFDVRSAKRIFGFIGGAGMAGAVLGGMLVRGLAAIVPSEVWCFFALATLVGMIPLLGRDRGRTAIHKKKISFREGISYAALERFPRGVALLVLFLSVQTAATDYVFRTGAVAFEGGREAQLAGMFGVLNAVVGVGALIVQVFFTAPLLRSIGVFAFLSLLPAMSIACAIWALSAPRIFAPLFLLKTLEMMGSLSLNQPALQLLYNPMPAGVRDSVRAIVDGAVKKMGGAAGGILLIAFGASLERTTQLATVVALAILVLIWIRALKPNYLEALEAKLGARGGSPMPPIDPSDRATREQMIKALSATDPQKVLAALSVLVQDPKTDLRPHIPQLILHRAETVRMRAIELVMSKPDPAHAPLLESLIQNDDRVPKAQAARALELVDPVAAKRVLEPIVLAPPGTHDFALVCAAIAALVPATLAERRAAQVPKKLARVVSLPGQKKQTPAPARPIIIEETPAEKALARILANTDGGTATERREVARLLGYIGPGPHAAHLARYLDDPEATVRAAAIQSAGQAKDALLPPKLIPRLRDRASRHLARDALAAYGDAVVPLLRETLDDRKIALELRVDIPRILRKIGSEAAAETMLFSNVHDDAFLRYVITEELLRLRRLRPELRFDRRRTHEAALRRLRAYQHYRPIARDLAGGPPTLSLLRRAVDDRVRQNLEAALRVLGLVADPGAMENACRGLLLEAGSARADALELIDVALQGSEVRGEVLASLEVGTLSAIPKLSASERAFQLVESRDIQLAMIAWESLKRIGQDPPDVREPSYGESLMPKSIVDRVFLLQSVQLFDGLDVDDLAAVAAQTTEGHAGPGEIVYLEGDPGNSIYVIISGEVRLLRGGQTLMELAQGDSFGQTSILDGGPRPVTAQAGDEGVDYLILERGPFMDLLIDRPAVVNGLFIVLARRLRELVELTGSNTATKRTPSAA